MLLQSDKCIITRRGHSMKLHEEDEMFQVSAKKLGPTSRRNENHADKFVSPHYP